MHNKIGYIKLYRSITENEIYKLPPLYLRVFERLILEANHQDNEIPYRKNGNITNKLIKRGEKLTSIRQICEWVGWYERGIFKTPNPKLVKEILDYLSENKMIIIYNKGNRTETHYKIVNYSVYQDKEDIKVTEQKQNRNELETEKKQLALQNNNDKECFNNEKECKKDIVSKKESKNKNTKTTYDEIINNYTDNIELKNTIIDFIKMRTMIKKKLTDRALNLILNKLDKLSTNDKEKIDILNQSIMNSYQGVFPLKANNTNNTNKINNINNIDQFMEMNLNVK